MAPAPEVPMEQPPMEDGMNMDPMAMGGEPTPEMGGEGEIPNNEEGGDDSTMSIINQLSDEDKKSVRAYAESMLDKNENEASEAPQDNEVAPPIPEGMVFTKKQLKEEFGIKIEKDEVQNSRPQPRKKVVRQDSPFNPPMFK
jgi:hypothetical protein